MEPSIESERFHLNWVTEFNESSSFRASSQNWWQLDWTDYNRRQVQKNFGHSLVVRFFFI